MTPQYRYDAALGPLIQRVGTRIFRAPFARTGDHKYGPGERGSLPPGIERRDRAELERIVAQVNAEPRPVTIRHPNGLIRDGAKPTLAGKAQRAWLEGELAYAELHLDDAGIEALEGGLREISLGYSTAPDENGFQRDSRVDHMALVFASRCGPTCSIRVDCACSRPASAEFALANQIIASRAHRAR